MPELHFHDDKAGFVVIDSYSPKEDYVRYIIDTCHNGDGLQCTYGYPTGSASKDIASNSFRIFDVSLCAWAEITVLSWPL